jgi:hypothetical protein
MRVRIATLLVATLSACAAGGGDTTNPPNAITGLVQPESITSSVITGRVTGGVVIYLLGGILEKLANPEKALSWFDLFAVGIAASLGLGFFTGGLQHFPDSPHQERLGGSRRFRLVKFVKVRGRKDSCA